jgi:murein DD-endopeptidase MepM/ murein hydrolase activator NlpD
VILNIKVVGQKPMVNSTDSFMNKIRFLVGVAIIIFGLLLLPVLGSVLMSNSKVQAASSNTSDNSNNLEESPNVITSGMFEASDKLGKYTSSAGKAVSGSVDTAGSTIATATVKSSKFVAHGIGSSAVLVANGVGSSVSFVAHSTGKVVGFIGDTPPIAAMIKPKDKIAMPQIGKEDPNLAHEEYTKNVQAITQSPVPAKPPQVQKTSPPPQVDSSTTWPIHGIVTTEFGASDWPYQVSHTGIDISDGKRSGVTPVKPFKQGRVVEVIHSSVSLGNHVVIDHGGGVTSVYGHMYTTSVVVGQLVDKNTALGLEGSTGASTGTHVHFEIRLNGTPVNPHNYISGNP